MQILGLKSFLTLVVAVMALVGLVGAVLLTPAQAKDDWHALYMHCEFPTNGQFYYDTAHDIGSLLLDPPESESGRYCSQWVMFDYDVEEETYHYSEVKSIYFHVWFDGTNASIGYAGHRNDVSNWVDKYGRFEMDDSVTVSGKIRAMDGDYRLFTVSMDVEVVDDIDEDNVYDFGVVMWKSDEIANYPTVISGPERISFVIFNLKSNLELRTMDTDSDGVSDYDELYTIYTNPFDSDTDSDGVSDASDSHPNRAGSW